MTSTVVWLSEAMASFRRLRAVDPDGAKQVATAVAGLADDSLPTGSTSLGGSDFRRLRLGNYRVLYEVEATMATVYVINVGSVPGPRR
jgi:mRNA interferase RelE/StbE